MSGYWIQILIFTVALLFFCWLLLEYWRCSFSAGCF